MGARIIQGRRPLFVISKAIFERKVWNVSTLALASARSPIELNGIDDVPITEVVCFLGLKGVNGPILDAGCGLGAGGGAPPSRAVMSTAPCYVRRPRCCGSWSCQCASLRCALAPRRRAGLAPPRPAASGAMGPAASGPSGQRGAGRAGVPGPRGLRQLRFVTVRVESGARAVGGVSFHSVALGADLSGD